MESKCHFYWGALHTKEGTDLEKWSIHDAGGVFKTHVIRFVDGETHWKERTVLYQVSCLIAAQVAVMLWKQINKCERQDIKHRQQVLEGGDWAPGREIWCHTRWQRSKDYCRQAFYVQNSDIFVQKSNREIFGGCCETQICQLRCCKTCVPL